MFRWRTLAHWRSDLPTNVFAWCNKKVMFFVGIYAHRYGYVPDGAELSISEMEYKAASEVSFPRFIYIVDGNHPWRPGYIDMGESRARLVAFKGALQRRHICQVFDTHDHLAAKVAADVGRHIVL